MTDLPIVEHAPDPHTPRGRLPSLPDDIDAFRQAIIETQAVLVVIDPLMAKWFCTLTPPDIDEETVAMYEAHARVHLIPFFMTSDRITEANVLRYIDERLAQVKRATVCKELTCLRRFLVWAKREHFIESPPPVENPEKNRKGTPYQGGKYAQRRIELEPARVEAIISKLPERTHAGHPARDFTIVLWETGLRVGTLEAIEAPGDYYAGRLKLRIRDEIDKARFGRELALTARSREALDRVCPEKGLIFGRMNLRAAFRNAGLAAGLDEESARHLSYHDFRHGRLTDLSNCTTDLSGMAFLAGHKHVTTTAKYVHSAEKAGERMVTLLDSLHQSDTDSKAAEIADTKSGQDLRDITAVAEIGVEPILPCGNRILSPKERPTIMDLSRVLHVRKRLRTSANVPFPTPCWLRRVSPSWQPPCFAMSPT